ncbi:MAG TPA: nucleotide exchange factor GrpE [Gemmatimonadetes bacterium]|jgi:molecular chaperone GrpE|nr:nucleotide exchange factor GrpE [Gemmatimonadota bacterium]
MKHSRKKGENAPAPDQGSMGPADDYAPEGSVSQGDGQGGDPPFSGSSDPAADPAADTRAAAGAAEAGAAATSRAEPDSGTERDRYLRLAAEYDNYRKRSAKERQDAGARAQADLVRELVEALDDVARFAHVDPATTDAGTIVQGVDMVEKKLLKALGNAGLEVINPVGETFDPALHEAVATEPTSAREDDHVVSRVYQPGYIFKSQLLRPARVVVKQWNG